MSTKLVVIFLPNKHIYGQEDVKRQSLVERQLAVTEIRRLLRPDLQNILRFIIRLSQACRKIDVR